MNLSRPDRRARLEALAGAYVLGTPTARTRMHFAHMARTDTVIASTIRAWERRLLPLADGAMPVTPPSRVWDVIALRLGLDPDPTATPDHWWSRLPGWHREA